MSARKCSGCGAVVTLQENGDLVCFNGHSQPEAVGSLVRAMAELVAGPLRELRATIEEQGIGLQSLHEEVKALRLERESGSGVEWVDLATEARRIGRSPDWLRDHARELGGTQPKPRGRWYFQPAVTDARLAALEGSEAKPAARPATSPRQLPGSVPLLDVKGKAA